MTISKIHFLATKNRYILTVVGSGGRLQEVLIPPPPPEMACCVLIQLVTNYGMWFIGVEIKHDHMRQGWRIYVKNHKNAFLARHVTSQFRHSLVVHPLIRKILDPPSLPSVLQKIRENISLILVFTWYKVSAFKIRSHLNPELSQEIIGLALFSH